MKKILFAAVALVFGLAMNAQTASPNADDVIKMNTEKHDFGKILQGKPQDYFFEITNKSDKAVVVENAWGSCGCTTPEKPNEPIAPGATAKLRVQYNAAAMGHFDKQVFIKLAGVEQPKTVSISGEVVDQAAFDEYVKTQPDKTKTETTAKDATKTQPEKTKTKANKTKSKSGK